jgi:hypothetical protein
MNFKLRILSVLVILGCTISAFAQHNDIVKNYDLKIGLTPMVVRANYSENVEYETKVFDNQYFKVIQFNEHPTEVQKVALKNMGVTLIAYLPNYAWLASFQENCNIKKLNTFDVRAIIEVPYEYKLSATLQLQEYPSHIVNNDNLKLLVTFFNTVNIEKITADLTAKGFQILESNGFSFNKEILVPINKINDFAALPYVQYVEPILPAPTFDGGFVEDRSNERGNYLASDQVGGLHYDGTGITIAVKEGGTVDPAVHNDFKGRLNYSLDGSDATSSHKTGVAQRMGAYGNDDPLYQGMAFGSNIVSTVGSFSNLIATTSSIAVNNSYGYGCYTGTYGSSGNSNDNLIRTNPTFMITYSAGNIGDTDCSYGAGVGWGTITGDVKQAKNVIAVGAVNTSDALMSFSSLGPAPDGRIKPDMCAVGPGGTSYACPNVTGAFGQLYHAYSTINGSVPNSGLIKGILQNTADDLGNSGPDFKYGYGRINMRRAYETILNNTIITDNVANGATDNHNIVIPAGTKQVRVMLYWTDYEGTAGSAVALVNNLNLTVTDPSSTVYNPWVLDHTINAVNLNTTATRGVDALNNMEQVTIDNPATGTYTITVNGNSVPQGPQNYYVVYELLEDEVTLTYPIGGESMVAGETQRIYWDSYGNTTGTFNLSYSTNNGSTWTSIVTGLSNSTRFYDWTVPTVVSGQVKVKVERGAVASQSAEGFSIIGIPTNLVVVWSCTSSLKLGWNAVSGATGYEVYKLGAKFMTSVGTTTGLHMTVTGVSTTSDEYFAVRALGANNAKGRRTNSLKKTPGDVNCISFEASAASIVSHPSGYFPTCYTPFGNNVKFKFLNSGTDPITSLSVKYQLGAEAIQTETFTGNVPSGEYGEHTFATSISILTAGTYQLTAWIDATDNNVSNNTATSNIVIYTASAGSYPYTQNFDAFTNCSNTSDCNTNVCTLASNWYNVPYDVSKGDDADWLTDNEKTPTGGGYSTGPNNDHTLGNSTGKFLYTETSVGAGCQGGKVYALTPCINLSTATKPELSFWYHMYGSNSGTIGVDILVNDTWTELFTKSGEQGSAWLQGTANLIPYVGKTVILRFRAVTGGGFQGDMAIDDITVQENAALPVEFVTFTATAMDNKYIQLDWQTATENNNSGFEIERSENGENWQKIGFVQGNGTTQEIRDYRYIDQTPFNGINYYRLKQIDFDGKFDYSTMKVVEIETDEKPLSVYPNPVADKLEILNGQGQAIIYNTLGQPIKKWTIDHPQFTVNVSDLSRGQYILHITKQNGTVITRRFVK